MQYRIYAGISGPLAHLPGPMISLFTNLILKYHVVKGQRMHYVHQIHQQYGPIARISPYEVIISDPQAVREVHKFGSEFTKSIWYQKFVSMPVLPGFAMTGADEHRKRRQLQGSNMTETYLAKCEPLVREKVELAVDSMMKRVKDQGFVDVAAWWLYMAADIISLLSFGKAFGMLEMGQVRYAVNTHDTSWLTLGQKNQFILDLENTGLKAGIGAELSWLIKLFERLHVPIFSEHGDMLARQRATADKAVRRLKERDEKDNQPSLFSKLWAKHGEGGLTDGEVAAEAQAYIVAGSDTTATTLTYLVWILSKHSDMEAKLIDEVRGRDADWSSHALKNLPYLNAVIEECLRLYGAAPGCLPRIVPGQGAELGGYFIPPGLTILTQSYTLHRDPNVFEDPER